jgi:hypothetical protein
VSATQRPLAVRILRGAGYAATIASVLAFGIGALLGYEELAKIWLVVGGVLLAAAIAMFVGARPTRLGLGSALVACTLLLLLPPVGTILTVVIALIASQSWPQLRDYYGLRRTAA